MLFFYAVQLVMMVVYLITSWHIVNWVCEFMDRKNYSSIAIIIVGHFLMILACLIGMFIIWLSRTN